MIGFSGVSFKGNLGSVPRVNAELGVVNLRVAVKMSAKEDDTEWLDVGAWGKGADFLAKAGVGDTVIVMGATVTRKTGTDGNKYLNVRCNSWDVTIVPKGTFKKAAGQGADSDLPF